jgi:hypothetical protein
LAFVIVLVLVRFKTRFYVRMNDCLGQRDKHSDCLSYRQNRDLVGALRGFKGRIGRVGVSGAVDDDDVVAFDISLVCRLVRANAVSVR